MNEDFVSYELAVKLKEKGFPQEDLVRYDEQGNLYLNEGDNDGCDAPTIAQVLKWLRKEKNILVCVLPTGWNHARECSLYYYVVYDTSNYFWKKEEYQRSIETYEEAQLEGIEYVLDNFI